MPLFASRRLASTSWVLLPMDETMPIPVTTTRRISAPCLNQLRPRYRRPRAASSLRRLERLIDLEQADFKIEGAIDDLAVRREPAVGDPKHEFRAHHALHVDAINQLFHGRQHLPGKLDLAGAERPPLAR